MSSDYLGYIGGVLTTFCYVPQIVRVFRLRSAKEISMPFTLMLLAGVSTWLSYGIYKSLAPVIIWNVIGIGMASTLIFMKVRYGR